jgi:CRP-like cAMP-binding protein
LYGILVPLNSLRLYEMLELIKKVRTASHTDLSIDWLKPFMHKHSFKRGHVLFHKGDHAEEMFFIVSGACRVVELDLPLPPGHLVGELAFLTAQHLRTQSVECTEDVEMLAISYDKVRELYFQNPTFGLYFLNLTSRRLLENVARMERELELRRTAAPA